MTDEDHKNKPITSVEFSPIEAGLVQKSGPISLGMKILTGLMTVAIIIMVYLYSAKAVIFNIDPMGANIEIKGLSFHIGDNYLLLKGDYPVTATYPGYYPLNYSLTVSDEDNQEVALELSPLPGNLEVTSELSAINITMDRETLATVPGLLTGINRGLHRFTFSKRRYFPLTKEVDIRGLDITQQIDLVLQPAWGQMLFTSKPMGAAVSIDGEIVGKTPMTTEVLETGSELTLDYPGHKTFTKAVTLKAGTTAEHPLIVLDISDGTLKIATVPEGATVILDKVFLGLSPLTVEIPPFNKQTLDFFLDGYLKASRTVTVEPEKTSVIDLKLKPNIGSISVRVSPDNAKITVNGRSLKAGSQILSLPAKPHSLEVSITGYETQTIQITPRPDQQQDINIKLRTLQQAYWSSRPPVIKNSVGSDLRLFQPDQSFTLGAPRRQPGRRANEVERLVRLERPFYLGSKEISNAQFRRWKEEHSSGAVRGMSLDMQNQPAVKLDWEEAALFCNWLSKKEGLPNFYQIQDGEVIGFDWQSHGYRLPTEAEWAWAAKISNEGTTIVFPWENGLYPPTDAVANYADKSALSFLPFTIANYNDSYAVSANIGSFSPNIKSLYNMSGNVAEWVNDYYEVRLHRGEAIVDPRGAESGNRHVIRGASWALGSRTDLRLSFREAGSGGRVDVGFRLARYVDKPGVTP
ncbi:MAG TPA: PEGA domain-containing protein [Porticoccaceae bacterium]|nr:PEGA domain-containing protein [Porticoccaceae bacterium]